MSSVNDARVTRVTRKHSHLYYLKLVLKTDILWCGLLAGLSYAASDFPGLHMACY
jgi:hypothetical protein